MIESPTSIFYRTCPGENNAPRPAWYSKELCLKSFLLSFDQLNSEVESEISVIVDGYLKPHDEWSKKVKQMVEPRGSIIEQKPLGNVESNINIIRKASAFFENKVLVFAEDDYLWLTPAILSLQHSIRQLPIHYSTPYDHPVRYQHGYTKGPDLPHWHNAIYITNEAHWRTQESTCMTFATTTRTLAEDIKYFEKYKENGNGRPEDRELFREMQGLGKYADSTINKRILVGPIPSLATHAHLPWLAPLINWEKEAKTIFEQKLI